ncbi:hypothetical protein K439DRAFT_1618571 [Ramaria rubella]|nr:hypothetical protein K439DRAFT_1618571 [Ramaria rubella]
MAGHPYKGGLKTLEACRTRWMKLRKDYNVALKLKHNLSGFTFLDNQGVVIDDESVWADFAAKNENTTRPQRQPTALEIPVKERHELPHPVRQMQGMYMAWMSIMMATAKLHRRALITQLALPLLLALPPLLLALPPLLLALPPPLMVLPPPLMMLPPLMALPPPLLACPPPLLALPPPLLVLPPPLLALPPSQLRLARRLCTS